MSEPGFAMNGGGWQSELPLRELSDPYEDDLDEGEFRFEDDWSDEVEIDIEYIEVDGKTVVSLNGQGHVPLDCE